MRGQRDEVGKEDMSYSFSVDLSSGRQLPRSIAQSKRTELI